MTALYATIWVALALFTAGEIGRTLRRRNARPPGWALAAFSAGLVLALVHTAISFDIVHAWSHDDAVLHTALQTEAVYGIAVGSGIYVNYVFFATWLADAIWWARAADGYERPRAVTWILRAFYFVMILNGAVIFAVGWRRLLGVAMVGALLIAWSGVVTRAPSSQPQ